MSTKTTLSLNLSDSDLLALEAIAGHNPELIADRVTSLVEQQLSQFRYQGAVVTFHSGDHLDDLLPVSMKALANGNILALAFTTPSGVTPMPFASSPVQPVLFNVIGKIDDDYLVVPTALSSRVLSGQNSLHEMFTPQERKSFFDIEALADCKPAFAAMRGQLGEGHIQMFPVTAGPQAYMQHDVSTVPVYRVPASVLYDMPAEVREEFNHYGTAQYQQSPQFGGGHYNNPRSGNMNAGGMFNGRNW